MSAAEHLWARDFDKGDAFADVLSLRQWIAEAEAVWYGDALLPCRVLQGYVSRDWPKRASLGEHLRAAVRKKEADDVPVSEHR